MYRDRLKNGLCMYFFSVLGFDPPSIFIKHYNYLQGHDVIVVNTNASSIFGRNWRYPDRTSVSTGTDYFAAHYLAKALMFKLR